MSMSAIRYQTGERDAQQRYINRAVQNVSSAINYLQREGVAIERVLIEHGKPRIHVTHHKSLWVLGNPVSVSRTIEGYTESLMRISIKDCDVFWQC